VADLEGRILQLGVQIGHRVIIGGSGASLKYFRR
jgi:hypothetical protein